MSSDSIGRRESRPLLPLNRNIASCNWNNFNTKDLKLIQPSNEQHNFKHLTSNTIPYPPRSAVSALSTLRVNPSDNKFSLVIRVLTVDP